MPRFKPTYSGPGKTGVCICGCPWDSHHLFLVMNKDYIETTGEGYIIGACCRYGFNEAEGMKYNEELDFWESHCSGYKDTGDLDENSI